MEAFMIFDTHTHYDDARFSEDREEVLAGLSANGVSNIINIGADRNGCFASVELAHRYDWIKAAVGYHPDYAVFLDEEKMAELRTLALDPEVVAIGEIGLDYAGDSERLPEDIGPNHELQKIWFQRQLALARELKKPVFIHSRDAAEDTLAIMKEHTALANAEGSFRSGIIHCFSYSPEIAEEYRKLGYYFGIGGVLTFKNARRLPEVVEMLPMDRILLETDCPYLAPVPVRGTRNDSSNLKYVVAKLAEIRHLSPEEVEEKTSENARRLLYGDTQ